MKTIKDVFDTFKQSLLTIYDANEVEAITLIVLTEVTGSSKATLKAFAEREVTSTQAEKISNMLIRLQTGEPVQYILGHTDFYGLTFQVNPTVLIPRPETEELVEWILAIVSHERVVGSGQLNSGSILDIGTGSGCIAISLKKHLPGFKVYAIDISAGALQTAMQNATLNGVDVIFEQTDLLNSKFKIQNSKFEIIISNPPYVTLHDKTQMHTNVTDFEPHTALFVPQDDPLIFYKAIVDLAAQNLVKKGWLFLEINESLGNETVDLLAAKGFKNIELRKDISGRNRMILARL